MPWAIKATSCGHVIGLLSGSGFWTRKQCHLDCVTLPSHRATPRLTSVNWVGHSYSDWIQSEPTEHSPIIVFVWIRTIWKNRILLESSRNASFFIRSFCVFVIKVPPCWERLSLFRILAFLVYVTLIGKCSTVLGANCDHLRYFNGNIPPCWEWIAIIYAIITGKSSSVLGTNYDHVGDP